MRFNVTLDCRDPERLAQFWAAALGFSYVGYADPFAMLRPEDGKGPRLLLQRVPEPKAVKNRMHLDLTVKEDLDGEIERFESLGARRLDEVREELGYRWVVMADPEDNEFCLGIRTS